MPGIGKERAQRNASRRLTFNSGKDKLAMNKYPTDA